MRRLFGCFAVLLCLAWGALACDDESARKSEDVTLLDTEEVGEEISSDFVDPDTADPDTVQPDVVDPCAAVPAGCCDPACPCADSAAQCLLSPGESQGVCKVVDLAEGECWHTGDCGDWQACYDVVLCPCGAGCPEADAPGTCRQASGDCCADDASVCGDGMFCMPFDGGSDTCHAVLNPPYCWDDAGCSDGATCEGAMLCSCDVDCMSQPGRCVAPDPCALLGEGCCSAECPCGEEDTRCVIEAGAATGVCLAIEGQGCWTDIDCADEEACLSARICPCGETCPEPNQRGYCQVLNERCCDNDGEDTCAEGTFCREHPLVDTCVAIVADPDCWQDSDCAGSGTGRRVCEGAVFCACVERCIPEPGKCVEASGPCVDVPADCCSPECPCAGNGLCVYPEGEEAHGVCKARATQPGQCWEDSTCGAGERCVGAEVCACGSLCFAPDVPGTCQSEASEGCCDASATNPGCPDGSVCVAIPDKEDTCLPRPASNQQCWLNSDCTGNRTCRNAVLCDCTENCVSQPGTCN